MGMMVEGVGGTSADSKSTGGAFMRRKSAFEDWVGDAEAGAISSTSPDPAPGRIAPCGARAQGLEKRSGVLCRPVQGETLEYGRRRFASCTSSMPRQSPITPAA